MLTKRRTKNVRLKIPSIFLKTNNGNIKNQQLPSESIKVQLYLHMKAFRPIFMSYDYEENIKYNQKPKSQLKPARSVEAIKILYMFKLSKYV